MDELLYASATTIAQAIREKRVSATEVVEAHLQRIATVNPTLNAVVPAFVQVTVAPTFTLISFGMNSNSFIVTVVPPGAGDCATETLPLACRSRVTTSSSSPRHLEACKVVSPCL